MSFFDESDESPTEVRSSARPAPRRRAARSGGSGGSRGSGGSGGSRSGGRRRPPGQPAEQSILARRAVAVVAVIIVIVLIAVGVDSCEGSAQKSALRDYANGVNGVITSSDLNSKSLFKALSGNGGDAQQISDSINQTESSARGVLSKAKGLSVPGSLKSAQSHLVLALQMRVDAITTIANQIQAALGTSVSGSAVTDIATQMARFYASDVLYKSYTAPEIAAALHGDGIAVGGETGAPISQDQFLPAIQWLTPSYVSSQLGVASSSGSGGNAATHHNGSNGLRGHSLSTVSVDGNDLSTGTTNTVTASPAPTFTLNFTNGGDFNEYDVTCKVSVTNASDTGTKVVAETFKGKPASCDVTLSKAPPKGTYTVVATIEPVPGESNTSNNTLSFPVTFQ